MDGLVVVDPEIGGVSVGVGSGDGALTRAILFDVADNVDVDVDVALIDSANLHLFDNASTALSTRCCKARLVETFESSSELKGLSDSFPG